MSLHIQKLDAAELAWANDRYAEVDFLPSSATDFIAVARVDGMPAALGRVTEVAPRTGELGGLYVFPEFRGLGIAKHLIDYLVAECGLETLFCLPFDHLANLYASAGFSPHSGDVPVPDKVLNKHAWCNAHYSNPVLLMVRGSPAVIQQFTLTPPRGPQLRSRHEGNGGH